MKETLACTMLLEINHVNQSNHADMSASKSDGEVASVKQPACNTLSSRKLVSECRVTSTMVSITM